VLCKKRSGDVALSPHHILKLTLRRLTMLSSTTKEAAAATVADAKNTAYSAKRDFNNATSDVKIDLNDVAAKAGRQVRGFIDSATDQFASASDAVVSEVRSNPVRSSAIALGVGLFLGALLRR